MPTQTDYLTLSQAGYVGGAASCGSFGLDLANVRISVKRHAGGGLPEQHYPSDRHRV